MYIDVNNYDHHNHHLELEINKEEVVKRESMKDVEENKKMKVLLSMSDAFCQSKMPA